MQKSHQTLFVSCRLLNSPVDFKTSHQKFVCALCVSALRLPANVNNHKTHNLFQSNATFICDDKNINESDARIFSTHCKSCLLYDDTV